MSAAGTDKLVCCETNWISHGKEVLRFDIVSWSFRDLVLENILDSLCCDWILRNRFLLAVWSCLVELRGLMSSAVHSAVCAILEF